MDTLDQLLKLAEGLYPTDDPDELGRLDRVIRKLSDLKRISMAELDGAVSGEEYRVVEENSASRSYNTGALLSSFSDKDWTLTDLLREDAVRLSWRWTELKKAARLADVTLVIASHEVEDTGEVGGEQIGETWKSSLRIEGIKQ